MPCYNIFMDEPKAIPGYEGRYVIYKDGRIFSLLLNRFLNSTINVHGYYHIGLSKGKKWVNGEYQLKYRKYHLVHRLVLMTYKPIDEYQNLQVNHIDGNPSNNTLENLEWCTQSENMIHRYRILGTMPTRQMKIELTKKILEMKSSGMTQNAIAKELGLVKSSVSYHILHSYHSKFMRL